jgi:hypothetical protein
MVEIKEFFEKKLFFVLNWKSPKNWNINTNIPQI